MKKHRRKKPSVLAEHVHQIKLVPVRFVCEHMINEKHSTLHRCTVGTVVMVIGVLISKVGFDPYSHIVVEIVGFAVHGFGCVPFIDYCVKAFES